MASKVPAYIKYEPFKTRVPLISYKWQQQGHQMTRGFKKQRPSRPQRFEARAQESPQVQAQFVRAVCMATCQLHRHMGFISQVSCLGHSNLCGSCLGFELVSLCQGSKAAIFVLNPAELLIDILSYPNRQWWHHVGKLRPGQWGKVGQPLQAVSLPKQDGWT